MTLDRANPHPNPLPGYRARGTDRPLWSVYAAENLGSIGSCLLQTGIFFFTQHYFGWGMLQNFLLASGQGAVYIIGSLASATIAEQLGRRRALCLLFAGLTVLSVTALAAPTATLL